MPTTFVFSFCSCLDYLMEWTRESNYYRSSNTNVGSTEQEIMNISKHKSYIFYNNLLLFPSRQSHFIIPFIAVQHSKQQLKLPVTFSGYCSSKVTLILFINKNMSKRRQCLELKLWNISEQCLYLLRGGITTEKYFIVQKTNKYET